MNRFNFLAGLLITGVSWVPFVSAQFYDTTATINNRFIVQNEIGLTAAMLSSASNTQNGQIEDAFDALIKARVNIPLANIPYPTITGVADIPCPGSTNPTGATCHLINATFLIKYNSSDFVTPPGQASATAVSDAINGGLLSCRLSQLYPSTAIKIRTGIACPETSIPPALLPTLSPISALNTIATLSNSFFISNGAGINASMLNANGNQQRSELFTAYETLLAHTIAAILKQGALLVEVSPLNITDEVCPTGLVASCQVASTGFVLRYNASDFPNTPPGQTAVDFIQAAIRGGNLICEHEKLFPNSVVVVRSGNFCPLNPTAAPVVQTPGPTIPGVIITTATLTNNFRILNSGIVIPTNQLLDSYRSLVVKRFATISASAGGPLTLGDITLGEMTVVPCPSSAVAGSVCNSVSASFQVNYTATDFTTPPATGAAQSVQDIINTGELDCELERLFPSTSLQVTTGGGCSATNPPTFDATATISNGFIISNLNNIVAATFMDAGNPQKAELAAAYTALVNDLLKDLYADGAVMDGSATIDTFTVESSCTTGATCHTVSASFKLKYNRSGFPAGGVGQQALDLVQTAINAGSLICFHRMLFPSSIIDVVTGVSCPASAAPITTMGPISASPISLSPAPVQVTVVPTSLPPISVPATPQPVATPTTISPVTGSPVTGSVAPTLPATVSAQPALSPVTFVPVVVPSTTGPTVVDRQPSGFPSRSQNPITFPSVAPSDVFLSPASSPVESPVEVGTISCADCDFFPFYVDVAYGKQTCVWLRNNVTDTAILNTICSSKDPLGYGFVLCPKTCGRC